MGTKASNPHGEQSLIWSWVLRQRGRAGLSPELSQTLVAASEALLSEALRPDEIRSICRAAASRLYQLPAAERSEICGHLELLEKLVPLLARTGRSFSALPLEARRKCIQGCERSRWPMLGQGHAKLRHLVLMAYMECPEAWPKAVEAKHLAAQVA